MGSDPIRLLAVDDHPIYRGGLAALIAAYPDLKLVAEAANGREAVELGCRAVYSGVGEKWL